MVPLLGSEVCVAKEEVKGHPHCFEVATTSRVYKMAAQDETDMQAWYTFYDLLLLPGAPR